METKSEGGLLFSDFLLSRNRGLDRSQGVEVVANLFMW